MKNSLHNSVVLLCMLVVSTGHRPVLAPPPDPLPLPRSYRAAEDSSMLELLPKGLLTVGTALTLTFVASILFPNDDEFKRIHLETVENGEKQQELEKLVAANKEAHIRIRELSEVDLSFMADMIKDARMNGYRGATLREFAKWLRVTQEGAAFANEHGKQGDLKKFKKIARDLKELMEISNQSAKDARYLHIESHRAIGNPDFPGDSIVFDRHGNPNYANPGSNPIPVREVAPMVRRTSENCIEELESLRERARKTFQEHGILADASPLKNRFRHAKRNAVSGKTMSRVAVLSGVWLLWAGARSKFQKDEGYVARNAEAPSKISTQITSEEGRELLTPFYLLVRGVLAAHKDEILKQLEPVSNDDKAEIAESEASADWKSIWRPIVAAPTDLSYGTFLTASEKAMVEVTTVNKHISIDQTLAFLNQMKDAKNEAWDQAEYKIFVEKFVKEFVDSVFVKLSSKNNSQLIKQRLYRKLVDEIIRKSVHELPIRPIENVVPPFPGYKRPAVKPSMEAKGPAAADSKMETVDRDRPAAPPARTERTVTSRD